MAEELLESELVEAEEAEKPVGASYDRDAAVKAHPLEKCYCPFGCTLQECDEFGYCEHLMGFTNDRKCYEPVVKIMVAVMGEDGKPTGEKEDTGKRRVVGRRRIQLIQAGDKIVNPKEQYFDSLAGGNKIKELWVSARVYRKNPQPAPVVKAS